MSEERNDPFPLGAILALVAVAQFLAQLTLLWKSERFLTTVVTIDDTYYYLQTAWNLKELGFVTFDGLHSTNGVQFLWFVLLYGLSFLAGSKSVFLLISIGACAFLNVLCYLPIARIGVLLKNKRFALLLALLWTGQTFFVKQYLFAMENSLHALVFWCVVWQMVLFCRSVQRGKMQGLWTLTVLLILNAWTRLDSALFSVVLYSCALWIWYRAVQAVGDTPVTFWQKQRGILLATAGAAGAAFAMQLLAFHWMGDSYLPVSALVKTDEAWQNGNALGWHLLDTPVDYFLRSLPPRWYPPWPAPLMALIGLLVLFGATWLNNRSSDRLGRGTEAGGKRLWRTVWNSLLLAFVLYHLVVWLSGARYEGYFTWYRSPLYIFWMLTAGWLLAQGLDAIGGYLKKYSTGADPFWINWAGAAAIVLLSLFVYIQSPLTKDEVPSHLYAARYDIALWMRDNFPPGTVFAAWNAGQLGYFSDHAVVNLDGLINNVSYYEDVLAGDRSLESYLQETGVMFVVDYENNPFTRSLSPLFEFPEINQRQMTLWQVPSP